MYESLLKYFDSQDWMVKARMINSLVHHHIKAGEVLFKKGDREPVVAYFMPFGSIAICKTPAGKLSSLLPRSNPFDDKQLVTAIFLQHLCDAIDDSLLDTELAGTHVKSMAVFGKICRRQQVTGTIETNITDSETLDDRVD